MTDRMTTLAREAAAHGLFRAAVRRRAGDAADVEPAAPQEAAEAVWYFLARPEIPERYAPEELDLEELDPGQLALALVAGARRIRQEAEAIELAAAQYARKYGITIRQLAETVGIAERSAAARYPRDTKWKPFELDPTSPEGQAALDRFPPEGHGQDAEEQDDDAQPCGL